MIGTLMYLITCTCADLAFCVSYLSQFFSYSLDIYHTALKRVFYYIFDTYSYVLIYLYSRCIKLKDF